MAQKRYTLFYPRTYEVAGEERTDFVRCGVAFPLKEKDGFQMELYFPIIPKGKVVALVHEDKRAQTNDRDDDEPPTQDDDFYS